MWVGGMGRVFSEELETLSSLPLWIDWAGLQKSALPWHHLQGPPQDSLLLTFALDPILALGPHPGTLGSLVSLESPRKPRPTVSLCCNPALASPQLEADASGTSSFPPGVGAPLLSANLSESLWL